MEGRSLQSAIRRECTELVGADFLRDLHAKDARIYVRTIAHLWLSIAAAFAVAILAYRLSPALLAVAWLPIALFIGTRINALNVQVHEGSHGVLARDRRWNDLLCNWTAGYPTLYDVDQYAAVHVHHHTHLSEAGDPERPYYRLPASRLAIAGCFLGDFFWLTFARRLRTIGGALSADARTSAPRMVGHVAGRLVCAAAMIAVLCAFVGLGMALVFYFLFWIVPLLSVYPMLIRLRLVAEHYAPEDCAGPVFVARTARTRALEHYLLGAQMEYHFEHHLFPSIPYANLHRLHDRLLALGFFATSRSARADHSLSDGYLRFWRDAVLRGSAAQGA